MHEPAQLVSVDVDEYQLWLDPFPNDGAHHYSQNVLRST